ncbi:hypothetical protein OHT61_12380 [Streptomyces sp. NBC_00178]|uniref:hypothetical protein n=1 Tax=Streptomyces sp. NBC_00178 TaxID=2975672 RepID=UPI002E2C1B41|nr:hypothetical protein [Streptomyces sp. NBC_00178]
MLIGSRRSRVALSGLGVAAALMAGAVACGSGGGDGEKDTEPATAAKSVAPEELCGGAAISAGAGKGLEVITGSSAFEESGARATVADAARALKETFTGSTSGEGDICRVHTPEGTKDVEVRITWNLLGAGPGDAAPASKYTVLDMGERAGAAVDGAFVDFACRSGELSGPQGSPAHVAVNAEPGGMPTEPGSDAEALKGAYATVVHSVSLAMAQELGCESDGGLPRTPVTTRK